MRFEVEAIDELNLRGPADVLRQELMSPFVWRSPDGELHLLIRVVPPLEDNDRITGRIWYGQGDVDGLSFAIDDQPSLVPGPGPLDAKGCEDPTVVPVENELLIYYTGLDIEGNGQMLFARGPNARELEKCGIALASSKTQRNTKEAAVERTEDGHWRLFYEYSQDWKSKIGLAYGGGPKGPWEEGPDPLQAREGQWDCWHLSTGPLLMTDPKRPVMFYNGSNEYPEWAIGWAVFAEDCASVIERCDEPLLGSPDVVWRGRDICFAASAISIGDDRIWLYHSRNDRRLFRATIRQHK